jgi:hypothetical protein
VGLPPEHEGESLPPTDEDAVFVRGAAQKIGSGCAGEKRKARGDREAWTLRTSSGWAGDLTVRSNLALMSSKKGKEAASSDDGGASVVEPPQDGGSATQTVSEDAEMLEAEAWIIGVV